MKPRFLWEAWNKSHIAIHDVSPSEATYVVRHASPPFPRPGANGKSFVWGRTDQGRYLQVIYVMRTSDEIDYESMAMDDIVELDEECEVYIYVIHARDLTPDEKSKFVRNR